MRQLRLKTRMMTDRRKAEMQRRRLAEEPDLRPLRLIINDYVPYGKWAMEAYLKRRG